MYTVNSFFFWRAPPNKIFCQLNECYNLSLKKKNGLHQACRVIFVITNFLMIFACLLNVHVWHYSDLIDHNGSRGAIAGYWASDLWIKNSSTVLKKLLQFIVSVTPAFLVSGLPVCSCHWHRPWKWGEEAHGWEKGWAAKQSHTQADSDLENLNFKSIPTKVQSSMASGLLFSLLTAQISLNPLSKISLFTELESARWGWITAHLQ